MTLTSRNPEPVEDVLAMNRQTVSLLVDLAAFLPSQDRLLLESILVDGHSVADVARGRGVNWSAVKRWHCRLIHRLGNPAFGLVARHLDLLDADERRLAEAVVFAGVSIRRASQALGLSFGLIRRRRAALLAKLRRLERDSGEPADGRG